jgi:hypothetical protein
MGKMSFLKKILLQPLICRAKHETSYLSLLDEKASQTAARLSVLVPLAVPPLPSASTYVNDINP